MARKNIHKSKKIKNRKLTPSKPVVQTVVAAPVAPATQPAVATTAKPSSVKAPVAQEAAAMRFAELPHELRRIALFSASVVVLLIVLWFFLK